MLVMLQKYNKFRQEKWYTHLITHIYITLFYDTAICTKSGTHAGTNPIFQCAMCI